MALAVGLSLGEAGPVTTTVKEIKNFKCSNINEMLVKCVATISKIITNFLCFIFCSNLNIHVNGKL